MDSDLGCSRKVVVQASPSLYLVGWCPFQAKQEFLRYPTRPSGLVTCLRCTLAHGCWRRRDSCHIINKSLHEEAPVQLCVQRSSWQGRFWGRFLSREKTPKKNWRRSSGSRMDDHVRQIPCELRVMIPRYSESGDAICFMRRSSAFW